MADQTSRHKEADVYLISTAYEEFLWQEGAQQRYGEFAEHLLDRLAEAGRVILTDDGPGHIIEFRDDGWTIKHPLACRPNLFDCPVNHAGRRDLLTVPDPDELGRFECSVDGDRLVIGARIVPAAVDGDTP